jgi:hypothetical protein
MPSQDLRRQPGCLISCSLFVRVGVTLRTNLEVPPYLSVETHRTLQASTVVGSRSVRIAANKERWRLFERRR